jgi:hypothetical protein
VFSNSSGSYSSNVNLAVENSSWSDEAQLQEMYLKRKTFAFNSDRPGAGGEQKREQFENAMQTVDCTFQVCVCMCVCVRVVFSFSSNASLCTLPARYCKLPHTYLLDFLLCPGLCVVCAAALTCPAQSSLFVCFQV